MVKDVRGGPQAAEFEAAGRAWRKTVAILVALALATAGLLMLEHGQSASAAPAPRIVHATHAAAVSQVSSQVAALSSSAGQLQSMSAMLTSNKSAFDAAAAVHAAATASSAAEAAAASRQLASIAQTAKASVASRSAASAAASALSSALGSTRTNAAALAARQATTSPIAFCNVTFTAFPGLTIDIPGIIHIVIPPVIVTIRIPCFLSGILHR